MPVIETKGAASSGGFGQFARSAEGAYIEDVFSTYLYTGNGSTQTITNGIDLSTKGGLLWIKGRSTFSSPNLYDTARGASNVIFSNQTFGNGTNLAGTAVTSFNANGFSLGPNDYSLPNNNGDTYVSWTFRKQAKFFDIVTYTGNGSSSRLINHSLGSAPGLVIIKALNNTSNWPVMVAPASGNAYGFSNAFAGGGLNTNGAGYSLGSVSGVSTATQFRVGSSYWGAGSETNDSGVTYVAYVFANNAGGFGASGTENAITCGTYTGNGSTTGPIITLGYEPQFLLIKSRESGTYEDWVMVDTMRGLSVSGQGRYLFSNVGNSEAGSLPWIDISPTGFQLASANTRINANGSNYIYMAIRRGPMRTPTSGTSVFSPVAYTGDAADTTRSAGFPVDTVFIARRQNPAGDGDGFPRLMDRLRGGQSSTLITSAISTEDSSTSNTLYLDNNIGFKTTGNNPGAPTGFYFNVNSNTYIAECLRRAPGFFDLVCYSGDGTSNRVLPHSLRAVPELIIWKARTGSLIQPFIVWQTSLGGTLPTAGNYLQLASSGQVSTTYQPQDASPTATQLTLRPSLSSNASGYTYVVYLFATLPGVSKVGSYTGTGAAQTINCGFTGGARFVMIKRTDNTGSWHYWDTARGITAGNDPFLLIDSTNLEDVNTNYISVQSSGFGLTATAPAALNANGGSYIFLAIA